MPSVTAQGLQVRTCGEAPGDARDPPAWKVRVSVKAEGYGRILRVVAGAQTAEMKREMLARTWVRLDLGGKRSSSRRAPGEVYRADDPPRGFFRAAGRFGLLALEATAAAHDANCEPRSAEAAASAIAAALAAFSAARPALAASRTAFALALDACAHHS